MSQPLEADSTKAELLSTSLGVEMDGTRVVVLCLRPNKNSFESMNFTFSMAQMARLRDDLNSLLPHK